MTSQHDCNDPPRDNDDRRRGLRHLRVGVELSEGSSRITRIWVVDQPAIQHDPLVHELIARIDLGGRVVLLESFDDPRDLRGEYRKGAGHSFLRAPTGVLYVSIPFVHVADIGTLRVRLAKRVDLPANGSDIAALEPAFDDRKAVTVVELSAADLRKHADWARVAETLGLSGAKGRFEIYVDCDRKFRWRLIGPGDRLVAECAEGHATRPECERELQWVRANARGLPVTSLDVGPKRRPPKKSS